MLRSKIYGVCFYAPYMPSRCGAQAQGKLYIYSTIYKVGWSKGRLWGDPPPLSHSLHTVCSTHVWNMNLPTYYNAPYGNDIPQLPNNEQKKKKFLLHFNNYFKYSMCKHFHTDVCLCHSGLNAKYTSVFYVTTINPLILSACLSY
jgi:hypothetical protein